MSHENYAKCKFYVYASTDATADAASCSTFAAFISTPEESKPKFWMHIKQCYTGAKTIPIHEVKNCFVLMQLHLMLKIFVCDAWLALWIFFEKFCSNIYETTLQY